MAGLTVGVFCLVIQALMQRTYLHVGQKVGTASGSGKRGVTPLLFSGSIAQEPEIERRGLVPEAGCRPVIAHPRLVVEGRTIQDLGCPGMGA